MKLFERLVDEAIRATPELTSLRTVVEKELLHHDILREMNAAGLLSSLTFIGGTCLRACLRTAICGTLSGFSSRGSNCQPV